MKLYRIKKFCVKNSFFDIKICSPSSVISAQFFHHVPFCCYFKPKPLFILKTSSCLKEFYLFPLSTVKLFSLQDYFHAVCKWANKNKITFFLQKKTTGSNKQQLVFQENNVQERCKQERRRSQSKSKSKSIVMYLCFNTCQLSVSTLVLTKEECISAGDSTIFCTRSLFLHYLIF